MASLSLEDADFAMQQSNAAWTRARNSVEFLQAKMERKAAKYELDPAAKARDQADLDTAIARQESTRTAYLASQETYKTTYQALASDGSVPVNRLQSPSPPPQAPNSEVGPPANTGMSPSPDQATAEAAGPVATNLIPQTPSGQELNGQVPGLQTFDDGSSIQTFDDGSTLVTSSDGQITATPSPPGDSNTTVPDTPGLNGQVPGLQVFDDGSSIQTFDDGSTLVTDANGNRTSTPASDGVGGAGSNATSASASRLSASTPEFPKPTDWRFRISLAPGAKYFYNDSADTILAPLKATKGVIFPYTPTIQVIYSANYEATDITHTNYKIYNYKNSAVDSITISGDFTAQDTTEANYLLAVIHFFRTMTKMFYGQDQNPARGVPPPLCYLSGFGEFQFDNHPVAITNFTYSLPTDVDYINATTRPGNISLEPYKKPSNTYQTPFQRLFGSGLRPGGVGSKPVFTVSDPTKVTRVPTKITLSIACIPIVTRNAISNEFSLQKYSTGELLRGSRNPGTGGGIW